MPLSIYQKHIPASPRCWLGPWAARSSSVARASVGATASKCFAAFSLTCDGPTVESAIFLPEVRENGSIYRVAFASRKASGLWRFRPARLHPPLSAIRRDMPRLDLGSIAWPNHLFSFQDT